MISHSPYLQWFHAKMTHGMAVAFLNYGSIAGRGDKFVDLRPEILSFSE
jgi:hypothetical protein